MKNLNVRTTSGVLTAKEIDSGAAKGIGIFCDGVLVNVVEDSAEGLRSISYTDVTKDDAMTIIDIKNEPGRMKLFGIEATYQMSGMIYVEAENKSGLLKKLKDSNFMCNVELPSNPNYIPDSLTVCEETIFDFKAESPKAVRVSSMGAWVKATDCVVLEKVVYQNNEFVFRVTFLDGEEVYFESEDVAIDYLHDGDYDRFCTNDEFALFGFVFINEESDEEERALLVSTGYLPSDLKTTAGKLVINGEVNSESVWEIRNEFDKAGINVPYVEIRLKTNLLPF